VPFYTNATACQPLAVYDSFHLVFDGSHLVVDGSHLDDNFLPMNLRGCGYRYADKTQWAPLHQVIALASDIYVHD
jgi:hypothetical protein